jgi:predicted DNA-binding transcriptional regulator AlpA
MAPPERQQPQPENGDVLVAPKRAAALLDVSRSQIDRIAMRAGWGRIYLSNLDRGSVRYRLSEIQKFIESRTVKGRQ